MRIGIMGGTFDPVHYGHLFVAEEARVLFGLEKVLFIPNGRPPHRPEGACASAARRYAMTLIATHSNNAFTCSPVEIHRSGPSYAVDTLVALNRDYPDAEFYYITGIDAVAELATWHRYEDVVKLTRFIAATRPGFPIASLKSRLPLACLERILPLQTSSPNISSTTIRDRIKKNLPIRYLTPDGVVNYIYEHRLYVDSELIAVGETA